MWLLGRRYFDSRQRCTPRRSVLSALSTALSPACSGWNAEGGRATPRIASSALPAAYEDWAAPARLGRARLPAARSPVRVRELEPAVSSKGSKWSVHQQWFSSNRPGVRGRLPAWFAGDSDNGATGT